MAVNDIQMIPVSGAILFKDIKGLDFSKMALYESVILPQKQPQVFVGARKPFMEYCYMALQGQAKVCLQKLYQMKPTVTF